MTRTLHFHDEHLRRFAEASGDRNPLHVDESFARQTPFGRCIAHGALVSIAALGSADEAVLRTATTIDLQFRQPVLPGEDYTVTVNASNPKRLRIEVTGRGTTAAVVSVTSSEDAELLGGNVAEDEATSPGGSPRRHTLDDLAHGRVALTERYACRLRDLSSLAEQFGAGHVPGALLGWLSAASYTVGMLIPGRDALFAGGRIARTSSPASTPGSEPGTLTASVTGTDDRTGMVRVQATLEQDAACAAMNLQTFVRTPAPAPDKESVGRYVRPSGKLSESNVLIVGASRGLGAALCGALATQGATVWAGYARSAERAERLREEFGADRIRPLQFDAQDALQTRRAFEELATHVAVLDGLVLCAAPPLYETALHPDATQATLRFLDSSLAMALTPLAESRRLLSPAGWVVVTSSSAVIEPPAGWMQYVTAKAALEGAAAHCARHTPADVLVVRPPKMWTDSTNTPLGRIGAAPTERVAAAIVRWATGERTPGALSVIGPEEILGDTSMAAAEG